MVAKMILPILGGSPSVWNTCMFFFQATLLLGYGYSHLATRGWGSRRHAIFHSILLFIPLAFLPIAFQKTEAASEIIHPILAVLAWLIVGVSVPFFVVSTSAPLVQKWFAQTQHPDRDDPYFLYAASNLGSLLGVLSYPLIIEPNFSLTQQNFLWTIAYGLLVIVTIGCATFVWKSGSDRKNATVSTRSNQDLPETFLTPPTTQQKIQWVFLSFLPSSFMLGVTNYITTDIASIPLLWAVPLAIYLLSFILTFSRKPFFLNGTLISIAPLFLSSAIALENIKLLLPVGILLFTHWGSLFLGSCILHGELAKNRPHPEYLTEFYFWISLGGVLGGLFNSIVAPWIFPRLVEYPLIIGLVLLLLRDPWEKYPSAKPEIEDLEALNQEVKQAKIENPDLDVSEWVSANVLSRYSSRNRPRKRTLFSLTLPIALGLIIGNFILGFQLDLGNSSFIAWLLTLSLFSAIGYAFSLYPWRWLVGVVFIILLNQFALPTSQVIYADRNFFGVNQVSYNATENYHAFVHGTTLHGKQSLDPQRQNEPLTYFTKTGPIGQLFQSLEAEPRVSRVGVMGLGVGTLAAYGKPGQSWTFYEIDPAVEKIASEPQYFTFLKNAKGEVNIVLGDGRLSIAKVPDNSYDLLVMDAFSSDSIPVHLITREAIDLYLQKLSPQGLLVLNITNRYLDLQPVIGALARDRNLVTLTQWDKIVSAEDRQLGKTPSHWVILARNRRDFGNLANDPRWKPILNDSSISVWTDNFSNLFRSLRIFKTRDSGSRSTNSID